MTLYTILKRIIAFPIFFLCFIADYIIYLFHKLTKRPYGSVTDIRKLYYDLWVHL